MYVYVSSRIHFNFPLPFHIVVLSPNSCFMFCWTFLFTDMEVWTLFSIPAVVACHMPNLEIYVCYDRLRVS